MRPAAHEGGRHPTGRDIILCVFSDEEAGGIKGARFLVEEHPHLFEDIQYGLGEIGGFALYLGGQKFYPIQVAEKLQCQMRLPVRGPAGHAGFRGGENGAMARLGQVLRDLDSEWLPLHITPVTNMMVSSLAEVTDGSTSLILGQLRRRRVAEALFSSTGNRLNLLEPLFRNTITPTIVRGGEKINVIPGEIALFLDGRMLPGFSPEMMIKEVQAIIGPDIEIEVLTYDPPASGQLNMSQFNMLAGILRELDPAGVPIPYMNPAVTDARHFARMGIQNYGFMPMNLPPDYNFLATIHAADERMPVESVQFGTEAMFMALQRYGGS